MPDQRPNLLQLAWWRNFLSHPGSMSGPTPGYDRWGQPLPSRQPAQTYLSPGPPINQAQAQLAPLLSPAERDSQLAQAGYAANPWLQPAEDLGNVFLGLAGAAAPIAGLLGRGTPRVSRGSSNDLSDLAKVRTLPNYTGPVDAEVESFGAGLRARAAARRQAQSAAADADLARANAANRARLAQSEPTLGVRTQPVSPPAPPPTPSDAYRIVPARMSDPGPFPVNGTQEERLAWGNRYLQNHSAYAVDATTPATRSNAGQMPRSSSIAPPAPTAPTRLGVAPGQLPLDERPDYQGPQIEYREGNDRGNATLSTGLPRGKPGPSIAYELPQDSPRAKTPEQGLAEATEIARRQAVRNREGATGADPIPIDQHGQSPDAIQSLELYLHSVGHKNPERAARSFTRIAGLDGLPLLTEYYRGDELAATRTFTLFKQASGLVGNGLMRAEELRPELRKAYDTYKEATRRRGIAQSTIAKVGPWMQAQSANARESFVQDNLASQARHPAPGSKTPHALELEAIGHGDDQLERAARAYPAIHEKEARGEKLSDAERALVDFIDAKLVPTDGGLSGSAMARSVAAALPPPTAGAATDAGATEKPKGSNMSVSGAIGGGPELRVRQLTRAIEYEESIDPDVFEAAAHSNPATSAYYTLRQRLLEKHGGLPPANDPDFDVILNASEQINAGVRRATSHAQTVSRGITNADQAAAAERSWFGSTNKFSDTVTRDQDAQRAVGRANQTDAPVAYTYPSTPYMSAPGKDRLGGSLSTDKPYNAKPVDIIGRSTANPSGYMAIDGRDTETLTGLRPGTSILDSSRPPSPRHIKQVAQQLQAQLTAGGATIDPEIAKSLLPLTAGRKYDVESLTNAIDHIFTQAPGKFDKYRGNDGVARWLIDNRIYESVASPHSDGANTYVRYVTNPTAHDPSILPGVWSARTQAQNAHAREHLAKAATPVTAIPPTTRSLTIAGEAITPELAKQLATTFGPRAKDLPVVLIGPGTAGSRIMLEAAGFRSVTTPPKGSAGEYTKAADGRWVLLSGNSMQYAQSNYRNLARSRQFSLVDALPSPAANQDRGPRTTGRKGSLFGVRPK